MKYIRKEIILMDNKLIDNENNNIKVEVRLFIREIYNVDVKNIEV